MVLSRFREAIFKVLAEYLRKLGKVGFKPWHFTLLGLFFSIIYLYMLAYDFIALSVIFLLASGLMDVVDGALAKALKITSRSGAYLDSMIDRLEDIIYYVGFMLLSFNSYIVSFALGLTLTLTYSKARLENLGINTPKISLFERSDRVIVLAIILTLYMFSTEASKILFSLYTLALTVIVSLRIITGYLDLQRLKTV